MTSAPSNEGNPDVDRPANSDVSIKEAFDWTPSVGIWGPDPTTLGTTGAGVATQNRKVRKPWGIRHVFLGLGIAAGLNVAITAVALAWITARGDEISVTAEELDAEIQGLATNPAFLILSLLTLWAGLLAGPFIASYRNGARSLAVDFWWRFNWKRDLLIGATLAIVLRVLDLLLGMAIQAAGVKPEDMTNSNFLEGQGVVALILLGLAASLGAPIVEELFFRGLTLQAFRKRWGAAVGVIVSSVIFGLMHTTTASDGSIGIGTYYIIAVTGTLGAVLAITTLRAKRLGPAVIAHVVFNASGVLLTVIT